MLWGVCPGHGAAVHVPAAERHSEDRDAERLGLQPGCGRVEGRNWTHCWKGGGPPHALGDRPLTAHLAAQHAKERQQVQRTCQGVPGQQHPAVTIMLSGLKERVTATEQAVHVLDMQGEPDKAQ